MLHSQKLSHKVFILSRINPIFHICNHLFNLFATQSDCPFSTAKDTHTRMLVKYIEYIREILGTRCAGWSLTSVFLQVEKSVIHIAMDRNIHGALSQRKN